MKLILILIVRTYQVTLAPLLGGACRFHPSCSHYAVEAIERHGAARGGWLALKRLARCRPLAAGGYDPVPDELPAHRSPGWEGVTDGDERGQTLRDVARRSGQAGRSVLPERAQ